MKASKKMKQDTKWVFVKKGTCSRTLFYILNREYDNPLEEEEMAADPLAGGIMQHGYQCGQLFGTVMGVGAEAYHRNENLEEAIPMTLKISQQVESEFKEFAGSSDCIDITETDLSGGKQIAKFMLSGKFYSCLQLADRWAAQTIKTVSKAFESYEKNPTEKIRNCAADTLKKMGANEREQAIVSGLAGGVGLSGNACGALSAVIWYKALQNVRNGEKPGLKNPDGEASINAFLEQTDYEFLCSKICGKRFKSAEEHSEYIELGGCEKLIDIISKA